MKASSPEVSSSRRLNDKSYRNGWAEGARVSPWDRHHPGGLMFSAMWLGVLLVMAPVMQAQAQAAAGSGPGTVQEWYARARALLDAALAAHGGAEALRAARRITVSVAGEDHWRNQS